jgi:uncharacterized glyoxalase superfamily protein PhnB
MSVKPIPEGYHSITPYLGILKAAEAIEFYKKAFGATQVMRLDMPTGASATPSCALATARSCSAHRAIKGR